MSFIALEPRGVHFPAFSHLPLIMSKEKMTSSFFFRILEHLLQIAGICFLKWGKLFCSLDKLMNKCPGTDRFEIY